MDDISTMIKEWIKLDYIKPEDIPDIELYMDQITTFMETNLAGAKRNEKDKLLTKTMINNYTKNKLLPPPHKKKYSKNHLYLLIFIYYLKNFLSIGDIQDILTPLTERFYDNDASDQLNFDSIYNELFQLEKMHHGEIKESIAQTLEHAKHSFEGVESKDKEFLQNFSLITLLSYDIYMRKLLIERMIDDLYKPDAPKEE